MGEGPEVQEGGSATGPWGALQGTVETRPGEEGWGISWRTLEAGRAAEAYCLSTRELWAGAGQGRAVHWAASPVCTLEWPEGSGVEVESQVGVSE